MSDEDERSSGSEEVKVSEFDARDVLGVDEIIRRLPEFFTISVASRRNSGKSHLCRQLVQLLVRRKR